METPAIFPITGFLNTSFSQLFTFTGETFTNLTWYADIYDSAGTKKDSFTVTVDGTLLTIVLSLTDTEVDTLGEGQWRYRVWSENSTSGFIRRRIEGKFIILK